MSACIRRSRYASHLLQCWFLNKHEVIRVTRLVSFQTLLVSLALIGEFMFLKSSQSSAYSSFDVLNIVDSDTSQRGAHYMPSAPGRATRKVPMHASCQEPSMIDPFGRQPPRLGNHSCLGACKVPYQRRNYGFRALVLACFARLGRVATIGNRKVCAHQCNGVSCS